MVFTAITSLPTNLTSLPSGLSLGVAGKYIIFIFVILLFEYGCRTVLNLALFVLLLFIFLCPIKVYRIWWPKSPAASWRFSICCCSFHTKGWIICQLLYGWSLCLYDLLNLDVLYHILENLGFNLWLPTIDSTMEELTLDALLEAHSLLQATTMMLLLMSTVR